MINDADDRFKALIEASLAAMFGVSEAGIIQRANWQAEKSLAP